jgi:flagellar hook assembly protein FlgD
LSYDNDQMNAGGDVIVNEMWAAYRNSVASVKKSDIAFPAAKTGIQVEISPNPLTSDCGKLYVRYTLDHPETISMAIYNFNGKRIKELICGQVPAGSRGIVWDGSDGNGKKVGPGVYILKCGSVMREVTLLP